MSRPPLSVRNLTASMACIEPIIPAAAPITGMGPLFLIISGKMHLRHAVSGGDMKLIWPAYPFIPP